MDKIDIDLDMESPINNNYHPSNSSRYQSRRRTSPSSSHSNKTSLSSLTFSVLAGLSLPIILPTVHMLLFAHLWGHGDNEVDQKDCTCSCWDTVFKGPYENGVAKYKHVYFNSTANTWKMWVATVLFFIALYEIVKHVILLRFKGRLRWSMAILLMFSLHSHYYAWWGHWNYWNDDFYKQWAHQLFFTLTEGVSTVLVLSQMDRRRITEPLPLLLIGTVAAFHISSSTWDQFFLNVVQFEGMLHQILRDVLLMATDCIQVFVVYRELRIIAERRGVSLGSIIGQRNHLMAVGLLTLNMFLYVVFIP